MDPRVQNAGPQQRKANLSAYMIARNKASMGEKVNFCPFGCDIEDLDDHWCCPHVVGYTVPGDDTVYEPRKERIDAKTGKPTGVWYVDGTDPQKVQRSDKLERITVSSVVYRRDVTREAANAAG